MFVANFRKLLPLTLTLTFHIDYVDLSNINILKSYVYDMNLFSSMNIIGQSYIATEVRG